MLGRKVKSRLLFSSFLIVTASVLIFIVLKSIEENVVYFFSPTEIYNKENISFNTTIRVGGLVKKGSINKKKDSIDFIITDLKNEIIVTFTGLIPNLFSEGKGVIAEGKLQDKKFFIASKILAKHDENYMPPEVKKALENDEN